jgi:leucyl-tRNA synthetase
MKKFLTSFTKKASKDKRNVYDPKTIEPTWQKKWADAKLYKTKEGIRNKEGKEQEKYYVLDMFPYPSGEGLHVGHPKGYIATDIISRFQRMHGKSVLHPMGFDAFGLPAENYALKTKTHPEVAVKKNVERYKKQLEILGFDYDWSREVNTTDPEYYRWTQWIFLQLFKKGLAYQSFEPINWCPSCKTGLANEDVEDGRCERCGTIVEKKPLRQWVLKITDYADRLLTDLDVVKGLVFTNTNGSDAFRSDMPASERQVLHCLIKHWKDDAYLCMKWKKNDWCGFVIGGIEKGESAEHTAVREVMEETGYKDVVFKKIVGSMTAEFYQQIKQENRRAFITTVYLELTSGEQDEVSQYEKDIQDMEWVPREKVRDFINRDDLKYEWDVFTGAAVQKPLLDWPEAIKQSQRNWIGRSEGAEIKFEILHPTSETNSKNSNSKKYIEVFTTRPDTLFGVTYVVLAPEHGLVQELLGSISNRKDVEAYVAQAKLATQIERTDAKKEKTGVELKGIKANKEEIPLWISDYVLADYGTGAVMAVPAHDERDWDFAKKFGLPVKKVIYQNDGYFRSSVNMSANSERGLLINSKEFNDLDSSDAAFKITEKYGIKKTTYKLRDWVFSRQRYWGEPIPLIHCEHCGVVPVPEKDLPVKLPKVKSYEPTGTGESPLAAISKWVNVKCPQCKSKGKRETNTMPQWAGSSWYYLRYMDPKNKKALVDPKNEKYWAPVDMYVGGAEHATRHLIYARFWHKFLYDIGVVSTIEPFKKLQSVGLIMGEDGRKMSKRFGNVVNPDDIVANYGADTLRLYEMFMGPFDQQIAWSTSSMVGSRRFIEKVWRLNEGVEATTPSHVRSLSERVEIAETEGVRLFRPARGNMQFHAASSAERAEGVVAKTHNTLDRILHKTIKKVSEDIKKLSFNTAISTLMITVNEIEKMQDATNKTQVKEDNKEGARQDEGEKGENKIHSEMITREQYEILLKLLAPFAPHVTEELWYSLGNKKSIHISPWPLCDEKLIVDDEVTIIVQVNGKVRGSFVTQKDAQDSQLETTAKDLPEVKKWIEGKEIKKVIVVKGKLVSIVVG